MDSRVLVSFTQELILMYGEINWIWYNKLCPLPRIKKCANRPSIGSWSSVWQRPHSHRCQRTWRIAFLSTVYVTSLLATHLDNIHSSTTRSCYVASSDVNLFLKKNENLFSSDVFFAIYLTFVVIKDHRNTVAAGEGSIDRHSINWIDRRRAGKSWARTADGTRV